MSGFREAEPVTIQSLQTLRQAEAALKEQGVKTKGGNCAYQVDLKKRLGSPKDKRQKV